MVKRLNHIHWLSFTAMSLIGAAIVGIVIALLILSTPAKTEYNSNNPDSLSEKLADEFGLEKTPKGETIKTIDTECDDPKKYAHPELGCICKEDYRTSTNFRGTFCLNKGRTYSYWPE